MNENDIRKMMKYGIISPSAGFTDNLIMNINAKYSIIKRTRSAIFIISIGCFICSLLLLFITLPEYIILGYPVKLSPIVIQVPGTLFILHQILQIFKINELITMISNLNQITQNNKV